MLNKKEEEYFKFILKKANIKIFKDATQPKNNQLLFAGAIFIVLYRISDLKTNKKIPYSWFKDTGVHT